MNKKGLSIIILIICFGLILTGCAKKTVVKEEPSLKKAEELAPERERPAKLEAERAAKETKEVELARIKEEESRKALEKEVESRKVLEKEVEARKVLEKEVKARKVLEKEVEARKVLEKEVKAKKEAAAAAEKEVVAAKEKVAKLEAEQALKEKEEKAKEEAVRKEFEKSLVVKRYPGIEGEVLESKLIKDIHFNFDKYDIRPGDTEILKENAALLTKHPSVKIQIEGHCDERGTIEYNLALGERRANSTKQYLISLGISSDRISTISYGEERPSDPGHNEEAWAKNRRAHSIILSK
jgi:peptidoglycan-associated lipoprotein